MDTLSFFVRRALVALLLGSAPGALQGQELAANAPPATAEAGAEAVENGVCCTIVEVNGRQGRGTVVDHRTGEEIAFHVTKRSLAARVKVGEPVRVDRETGRMTLYSPEPCCLASGGAPDLGEVEVSEAIPFVDCCVVVEFEAGAGHGVARVRATGATFEFHQVESIFSGMEPGDRLWVEPGTGRVGVGRDLECCAL